MQDLWMAFVSNTGDQRTLVHMIGIALSIWCPRCGFQSWFDLGELGAQVGWILIPTNENESSYLEDCENS